MSSPVNGDIGGAASGFGQASPQAYNLTTEAWFMLVSSNRFLKQCSRIVIAALGLSIIAIISHAGQVGPRSLREDTHASSNPTATDLSPVAVTYTITSNPGVSDQLNVYGTLTNANAKMKVIGLDESQQVVTERPWIEQSSLPNHPGCRHET